MYCKGEQYNSHSLPFEHTFSPLSELFPAVRTLLNLVSFLKQPAYTTVPSPAQIQVWKSLENSLVYHFVNMAACQTVPQGS